LYYKGSLDLKTIPEPVREVLERLKETKGLVIKGGLARLALLEMLIKQGKRINSRRLEIERNIKDLDIILIHYNTLPQSRDFLLQKEQEVRKKLEKITLLLRGQDIEPVRGKIDEEGNSEEKTIRKILGTRDLTINEIVLVPENKEWQMCYTKRCWRDAIRGIGMLNARDSKTTRMDLGRIVPSNRGFYRLFRFWVEGKVEMIWLPEWQRVAHLLEMARRQLLKELPLGANLGRYSLVIGNNYRDADVQTKRRWMIVLRRLGFTDLGDWETFVKEQNLLDELRNGDFEFESELPFEEIIDRLIAERAQRQEAREQRRAKRDQCEHQFESLTCEGCPIRCVIQKCQKCTRYLLDPRIKTLPCNEIFLSGNWRADERALMRFPGKF
jgi:hypothetical protein